MPYRYESSAGQVIESEHTLEHLEGLARWARTVVESSAPANEDVAAWLAAESKHEAAVVSWLDAEAAHETVKSELEVAVADAEQSIADLNEQLETPAVEQDAADVEPLPKPTGSGADDRDEWIEYALANGKTETELKGVKTKTIASWFE